MEWTQLGDAQHLERAGLGKRTRRRAKTQGRTHTQRHSYNERGVAVRDDAEVSARLALWVALLVGATSGAAPANHYVPAAVKSLTLSADTSGRPKFRLGSTPAARQASGWVELVPAQSPFGVATTRDGRLVFDLDITVTDLPAASDLGPYTRYEAWLTTPKLDLIHDLGSIENGKPIHAQADWNKFTIIVSAEAAAAPHKWSSAIALIGRSPSSLMQSFASHPLFSTPEPD